MYLFKVLLVAVLLACMHNAVFSQDDLYFEKYDAPEKKGSTAGVATIAQDNNGFIWFKTPGMGIHRYDGHRFTELPINIQSENKNRISDIVIDNSGRLWVLGFDFLAVLDEDTQSLREITLVNDDNKPVRDINKILHVANGRMWLERNNRQLLIETEVLADSIKVEMLPELYDKGKRPYEIIDIVEDRSERIWASTPNGLLELDTGGAIKDFVPFDRYIQNGKLYLDLHSNIWISTSASGPVRFEPDCREFYYAWDHVDITGRYDSLNFYYIGNILQDNDSIYWVATSGSGLVRYNIYSESARVFRANPLIPGAISGDYVSSLLKDRYENIIIRTRKGVSVLKRNLKYVNWFFHDPSDHQTIGSHDVTDIFMDGSDDIWIAVEGSGVDQVKPRDHSIKHFYPSRTDPNSLSNARTMRLIKDRRGWVWAGHWEGGLTRFNPEKNEFIRYTASRFPSDSTIAGMTVTNLMEDKAGNVWVATMAGVDVFDTSYQHIERFPFKDTWALYEENDRILMGGEGRFGYLHDDSLITLLNSPSLAWIRKFDDIYYLSDYGLGIRRFNGGEVISEDSISFRQLLGGLEDEKNQLWFQKYGEAGVVCYDPTMATFDLMFKVDAATELFPKIIRDGKIWGRSDIGLFYFDPNHISQDEVTEQPVFTSLKINGKPVQAGAGKYLDKPVSHSGSVRFDHNVKSFELSYAVPFIGTENKPSVEYKLEGYDDNWIAADPSGLVVYMNLPPDNYSFLVRATAPFKMTSPVTKSLEINVVPAPWATWWAYVLYGMVVLLIGYLITYYLVRQARLQHSVELQKLELDQVREVDRVKTEFFTNISHEFRTPLTLILGPLRQMKEGRFNGDRQAIFGVMIRNSERLLNLINQLLDINKMQYGKETLKISIDDFVEFTKHIYASFESVAKIRNINYTFQSNISSAPLYFDPDKMDKVLTNLLSNAFKFTPDHGTVNISINNAVSDPAVDKGEGVLQVSVSDNGPGIPSKKLDKIFDYFYQVESESTRSFEGSGIGLALVREYVKLHKGTVIVDSIPGKGSTFYVRMPVGNKHLGDQPIHMTTGYQPKSPVDVELSEILTPTHQPGRDKPRLLIVEDNPDMRIYMHEILGSDFVVSDACDGLAGFDEAIESIPDLIISDVMMPKMDGYELCSKLKQDERTSHIPIILLTARAGEEARLEGFEYGADDYITKPFSPAELRARVHSLMELIRSLREKYKHEFVLGRPKEAINSREERFLNRFMDVLEINRSNTQFGSEQCAEEMGMSRSQLHRKLKALTGQAVGEFIKSYRLNYAKELLEKNYDNVTQVAYEVGFNSPSYFTESFKKEFGVLPSEVRKKA